MFTRRAFYHPYKRAVSPSPAGLRIKDYIPRRCFNLFGRPDFNADSPSPSPLNSPVRGAGHPQDDPPPTLRLGDLFGPNGLGSPQRPFTPTPDHPRNAQQADAPAKPQFPIPPPRKTKYGPKHLSFSNGANGAHRFRRFIQQLKEKPQKPRKRVLERHERRVLRARESLSRLLRQAETVMEPRYMTREDRIFLKQLQNLQDDQVMAHDLESYRQRMARAAEEAPMRMQEQEERDREAARLWAERDEDKVREEQRKKVDQFVRAIEDEKEAKYRKREEEAMRIDAERQRAHDLRERVLREEQERRFHANLARKAKEEEERKIQEEQDRRMREEEERRTREEQERQMQEERERQLREWREEMRREEMERREREEMERQRRVEEDRRLLEEIRRMRREAHEEMLRAEREHQLREEAERLHQEAHERLFREENERAAREERERQARILAEQARRAAEEEQVRQQFILYEGKWNELRTSTSISPIDVREMPWPVFCVVTSADQITHEGVKTFLFHALRPGVEGKTARDKVKAEVLRFHPDKFDARVLPKIQEAHREVAKEIAGAIARILTRIMTEDVEQEK